MPIRNKWFALTAVLALSGCAPAPLETVSQIQQRTQALLSGWQETKLPSPMGGYGFGLGVAVAGSTAFVGSADGSGSVVTFAQTAQGWGASSSPLLPPDPRNVQGFGSRLAATKDLLVVGETPPDGVRAAVWVFSRVEDDWQLASPNGTLSPSDAEGSDSSFGLALAVEDGTIAVGAPYEDGAGGAQPSAGSVYIFQSDQEGHWTLQKQLYPIGLDTSQAAFGSSLALHGNRLVVGAPGDQTAGAVYVFDRTSETAEFLPSSSQLSKISAPLGAGSFGTSVEFNDASIYAGASDNNNQAGAVYVFSRSISSPTLTLTPADIDTIGTDETGFEFGSALALTSKELFVSAPGASTGDLATGRVAAYRLPAMVIEANYLYPSDGIDTVSFGISLSASPSLVLVGSPGKAYAYQPTNGTPCSVDSDCGSAHCSDGVCCNSACSGACESCLAVNTGGLGDGVCLPSLIGPDTRKICRKESGCGQTGLCDGHGACALESSAATCAEAGCASSTASVEASHCDGAGSCALSLPTTCTLGYVCKSTHCMTVCSADDDCDRNQGFYCFEKERCISGASCSTDRTVSYDEQGNPSDCGSTLCREGVCPSTCKVIGDCAAPLVCDPFTSTCILQPAAASQSGCTIGRPGAFALSFSYKALCALVALVGLRRRRRW